MFAQAARRLMQRFARRLMRQQDFEGGGDRFEHRVEMAQEKAGDEAAARTIGGDAAAGSEEAFF